MNTSDAELAALDLASSQFGVIHVRQAAELGLNARALSRRLERGWRRMHPGVVSIPGYPDTFERRAMAAHLYAGADSLLSHGSAGCLHGLDGIPNSRIEISTARRLRSKDLAVHQRDLTTLRRKHFGPIPATTIDQTIVDLAGTLSEVSLEIALDSALRQGLTLVDRVAALLDVSGGRGTPGSAVLRKLIHQRAPLRRPPESVVETRFFRVIRSLELPRPVAQHVVTIPGCPDIRLDFAYPHLRIAIEIDSVRWHSGLRAIHRDNRRQNLLAAQGWLVLRFEWDDVVHRPKWVAKQILAAIETRIRQLELG
jgi:very-short-patch-repair endonuclease